MQRGALASAARSDGQRSALDRASHRTAPNALQRNEKRKIILPRHHEDFRPNSQALQPKQESNLTKSAEDFNPNRGAVRQNQLGTLTLSTEYFDEARLPLRASEEYPLKQGKWSAQATRPTLRTLQKAVLHYLCQALFTSRFPFQTSMGNTPRGEQEQQEKGRPFPTKQKRS